MDMESATELLARAKNPLHRNPYGYMPQTYTCAIFLALFSLSTILHFGQALGSRRWYLIPTLVVGGLGEILGWAGRLWSSRNVLNITPFLIQISTTIIAPTFLAAANFIILGTIITRTGAQYSRLPARWYALIFVTVDVIALVIQAIGGGMASAATQKEGGDPNKGGHVMLLGIIIQLVEIAIYVVLAGDFFFNYARGKVVRRTRVTQVTKPQHPSSPIDDSNAKAEDHHETAVNTPVESIHDHEKGTIHGESEGSGMTPRMKIMSYGLALSTLTLLIRAIYRTCELTDGWGGRIIHTQIYFNLLDGAMIVLSMYTLNFIHPMIFLA